MRLGGIVVLHLKQKSMLPASLVVVYERDCCCEKAYKIYKYVYILVNAFPLFFYPFKILKQSSSSSPNNVRFCFCISCSLGSRLYVGRFAIADCCGHNFWIKWVRDFLHIILFCEREKHFLLLSSHKCLCPPLTPPPPKINYYANWSIFCRKKDI